MLGVLALAIATPALAQVKQSREQMMFYTGEWKGERFPDGRPKLPDDLLKRVLDVSIEDLWDYLRDKGYNCQFDTGFQMLHPDKPFAGRALTAQYMPLRRDMYEAIAAEGKREGRVSGNNSWPIAELQIGDMYVADGFGKIVEGTLIGSNLGSGIAAHSHTGFVFDAGIRDAEENRELDNMNGLYRAYDPSAWKDMTLTTINAPIRIGRATVLPGDLVLAKREGVIFIPAFLAEDAVSHAEFINLEDAFNFDLNKQGKNGGSFEGGWNAAKYEALVKWIDANPDKLKMSRAEFDAILKERRGRQEGACRRAGKSAITAVNPDRAFPARPSPGRARRRIPAAARSGRRTAPGRWRPSGLCWRRMRLGHLAARRFIGRELPAQRHGAFDLAMHRVAGAIQTDRRGEGGRRKQQDQGEGEARMGLAQAWRFALCRASALMSVPQRIGDKGGALGAVGIAAAAGADHHILLAARHVGERRGVAGIGQFGIPQ